MCSGTGALDMAAARALVGTIAWHVENDPAPSLILGHHWPDIPNHGDVKTTAWETVEPVDAVVAGYPCQPFSRTGNRKGTDDPRHIWPHIYRAIRHLRPRYVLLENVEDHLSMGFGVVLADLAEAGFDAEWVVLRASDVGAPHGRPRIFVIATDPRSGVHHPAQPGGMGNALRAQLAPVRPLRLAGDGASNDADQTGAHEAGTVQAWGPWEGCVRRWERIVGPAPRPLVMKATGQDVSPAFVEWMMGLPAGHVTAVPGLSVGAQFKALGNGVVPQQAEAAYRLLLAAHLEAAA